VGSGDRSERIRTYNFPQGRVTDHRIGLTLYSLDQVLAGEGLDAVIEPLIAQHQMELLAEPAKPIDKGSNALVRRRLAARIDTLPHADGLREARLLIEHVTGLSLPPAPTVADHDLTAEQIKALDGVARRAKPANRWRGFWGARHSGISRLASTRQRSLPRDDTGTLVEAALALLPLDSTAHVVDVGTGSGIILLALARERPHIFGTGIDLDGRAVAQARAQRCRRLVLPTG
jgi:hypothetical protein